MEQRIQSIDGVIVCSIIFVLSKNDNYLIKLENPNLQDKIDNIAKDFHVEWAVETSQNNSNAVISRTFGPTIESNDIHSLEIDAVDFMSKVSKLELAKPQPKDDKPSQLEDELNFCKDVLNGFDETEEELGILGATLLTGPEDGSIQLPCGRIGRSLLKKMFESFIKVHSNDE